MGNSFFGYEVHGFRVKIEAVQAVDGVRNLDEYSIVKTVGLYQSPDGKDDASVTFRSAVFPLYTYTITLLAIKKGYQLGVFRVNSDEPLFILKNPNKQSSINYTAGDFDIDLLDMNENRVRNKR